MPEPTPQKVEPLVIDLNNSQHARPLDAASILHKKQLETLTERVKEIQGRIEGFKQKLEKMGPSNAAYDRFHDVITVHGKRGSGKTTFLLSGLQQLEEKSGDQLCVLGVLDPTLFGLKEHILLTVLSKIAIMVNGAAKSALQPCSHHGGEGTSCKRERWQEELNGLATGLKYAGEVRDDLAGVAPNATDLWEDPVFSLQEGLNNAKRGLHLEQDFHRFLNTSLELLGKKAFVLALDDIDTRPNIGWHVLEVLRKYFTSPQLIVILSGDLDLFTTIIRKKQLEVFGLDFASPKRIRDEFHSRVEGLTEQFLLKILRANNRINIGSFQAALLQWGEQGKDDKVKVSKDKTDYTLSKMLRCLFLALGCHRSEEQRLFRQTLFANPSRTVVQVLEALWEEVEKKKPGEEALAARLCEIFSVPMQNMGFEDPTDLPELLQGSAGVPKLMELLFTHDYSQQNLELLPSRTDSSDNNGLLALQVNLAQVMQNNMQILFAYAFKACLLHKVLESERIQISPDATKEHYYGNYANDCGFETENSIFITSLYISALLWQGMNTGTRTINRLGTVRLYGASIEKNPVRAVTSLYGSSDPYKDPQSEEIVGFLDYTKNFALPARYTFTRLVNTPETLEKVLGSWQSSIIKLGMLTVSRKDSDFRFISVHSLLALLGDIFTANDEREIRELLQKFSNMPVILREGRLRTPAGRGDSLIESFDEEKNEAEGDSDSLEHPSESGEQQEDTLEAFAVALQQWRGQVKFRDSLALPPTLISRIFSRFFDALKGIDDNHTQKSMYAGAYLHRCLVAFFNSVLVEEFLLMGPESNPQQNTIIYSNPITKDDVFLKNLQITKAICHRDEHPPFDLLNNLNAQAPFDNPVPWCFNSRYPLFELIFSCPLWGNYLKPAAIDSNDILNTVYNAYMEFQQIFWGGSPQSSYSACYKAAKGSEKTLPNLYYFFNSLTIPRDDGQPTQKAKRTDPRTAAGIGAGVYKTYRKSVFIERLIPDLWGRKERALVEKYRTVPEKDESFSGIYKQVVDLYYHDGAVKTRFLKDDAESSFWEELQIYFEITE